MTKHLSSLTYIVVWLVLIALTGASWALSSAHLGAFEVLVALGIAVAKSALVMLFFMHLIESRFVHVLPPIVATLLIALLAGVTALDVATRHTFPAAPLEAIPTPTPG